VSISLILKHWPHLAAAKMILTKNGANIGIAVENDLELNVSKINKLLKKIFVTFKLVMYRLGGQN
jgi:hypothetical protein